MNMVLLLILHILVCVVIYILLRARVLASARMVFPLVCFVPVWGLAALIMLEIHTRRGRNEAADPMVDKLRVEDEIYRNIQVEQSSGERQVAPINEILSMNDPKVRRSVIMEVLYDNPAEYIQQLQVARANDDTEVVHYAVTALVELQKDYDLKFQSMEGRMKEKPGDPELQKEYLELLERYVESGLIEGGSRAVYVRDYSRLLQDELKRGESRPLYLKKIKADMELKDYESVRRCAQRMVELWPEREAGYLKLIEYCALKKDRAGIDQVLEALDRRNVYLTPEGRRAVRFWRTDGEG